jgi:hypothetical protein
MGIFKSRYPPVPPVPEGNVYDFSFNRPEQEDWEDFPLYIESATSETLSFYGIKERVQLGATALSASAAEGGLGLQEGKGELVGVIGLNSTVSSTAIFVVFGTIC